MTDASGETRYCYDGRGNLVLKVQETAGTVLTTRYGHSLANRVQTLSYPSGITVVHGRDTLGRTIRLWTVPANGCPPKVIWNGCQLGPEGVFVLQNVTYLPFGPVASLTYGNNRVQTRSYDQNYGIDAITSGTGGVSLDYALDAVGNITGLVESGASSRTRTYGYDALDRLSSVQHGATPLEAYEYDATGNRTRQTLDGGAAQNLTYPATSHRLTAVGATARTYDANGNTTAIGTEGYVYDERNRLVQHRNGAVPEADYQYNGRGERVQKTLSTSGATTLAMYDDGGALIGEYDPADSDNLVEYVDLDGLPVALIDVKANVWYVEPDHLGTPRSVIEPKTNVPVWRWDLAERAFGASVPNEDPDGDATPFRLGLRFPGQRYDAESGLHYNYFRDYEPATGRYVESDPIGISDGPSTYSYVQGRPTFTFDPFGLAAAYNGFPPTEKQKMVAAHAEAIRTLRRCESCTDCGSNGEYQDYCITDAERHLVIAGLEYATYNYKPQPKHSSGDDVDYCAQYLVGNIVDIYPSALRGKCCSLPSLLAHEAGHDAKLSHQRIFYYEQRCFNCPRYWPTQ